MVYTNKEIDSLILTDLHKGQNTSKFVLLKNWNCFKISRIWRNSYLSVMHFGQKFKWVLLLQGCFNIQNVIPCSCRRYCFWQGLFWSLSKKKKEDSSCLPFVIFFMLWSWFSTLCHASSDTICSKDKNFEFYNSFPTFWGKKWNLLFVCHYSLLLFTVTIHCYYSWHCSLRIFAYLKGVVPYISSKFLVCLVQDFFPRESYPLWAFFWEISLLTTTSLHLYYLYKAYN